MCGINVILDFSGKVEANHLQKMMAATRHRGPDAGNTLERDLGEAKLFMGTNRLQIVDNLEASNQPFVSLNGQYALVFNGEIYNYEEIRNNLLKDGVLFMTQSDTEVLLFHLIKNGREGLSDLNGMFAFVFADLDKGELIVARDTMGIKPLFVHKSDKSIIISSEINGILDTGLVKKKLNEEAIPFYLAYKYVPKPATFYQHVEELLPGAVWKVDTTGKVEQTRITQQRVTSRNTSLKEILVDSIVQQYSEANNTGIMLSGGVDSTLLLAVLNRELGYNHVPVYSITGTGRDGHYAQEAARQYKAEFNPVMVNEPTLDWLNEFITTIDQPIADSAALLTWLIGEKARGYSKVLLSGAGADELFAGYNRHRAYNAYLKNRSNVWFKGVKWAKHIPNRLKGVPSLKKWAGAIHTKPSVTFNNFLQSEFFRLEPESLWEEHLDNEKHMRNALVHDQGNYLPSDVLAITDQATMHYAVETRVPYLDGQLIAYSRNLPATELLTHGSKWMLKDILNSYGGKKYIRRKKFGLGLPLNTWFKKSAEKEWWDFNKKESQIHTFVTSRAILELITKHQSGKADYSQELWRVLVLHKWLEHNFE